MDLAIETGKAAGASHRIISQRKYGTTRLIIQERSKFLWLIPFWRTLHVAYSRSEAEAWLHENWKLPAYFTITRKPPA